MRFPDAIAQQITDATVPPRPPVPVTILTGFLGLGQDQACSTTS